MEKFAMKQEEKKDEATKPKFMDLMNDNEEVEVKRLDSEDIEDVVKVMRKCAFDVTEAEVRSIIKYEMSFGCHVNRMLIGVGLSWPANYNADKKAILGGEPNALYLEDPAVLLAYEGRGIRSILLKERETEAIRRKYSHTISYLYEDVPKGSSIVDMIKEAGSQLEKLYLTEGYEFFRTSKGVLSVKKI